MISITSFSHFLFWPYLLPFLNLFFPLKGSDNLLGFYWNLFNSYNLFLRGKRSSMSSWFILTFISFSFLRIRYWPFLIFVGRWRFFLLVCRGLLFEGVHCSNLSFYSICNVSMCECSSHSHLIIINFVLEFFIFYLCSVMYYVKTKQNRL